jgi:hypothetical protein
MLIEKLEIEDENYEEQYKTEVIETESNEYNLIISYSTTFSQWLKLS